jgi:uncharacterized membrane protein
MGARPLRVLVAFASIFAAFTLTLASALWASPSFVVANFALPDTRRWILLLTVSAFIAAFAVGAVLIYRSRRRALDALMWVARLASPVLLLPVAWAIGHRHPGAGMELAGLLAAFALGLERLLRVSFTAWQEQFPSSPTPAPASARFSFLDRPRLVLGAVLVLAAAHTVFMCIWAIWGHHRFLTAGYDLGQYDQLFQTTLHGRWLASPAQRTPENWGDLAGSHVDLIIFPLLPFYALYPKAETLLVLQDVFIGSAAVPVFLFAKRRLPIRWAFVLAIAWLAYVPTQSAQIYDFHTQPFGCAMVVWAIWAVDAERWRTYWVFFALALSAREDVSMGLAALGIFLALTNYRFKTGLTTTALAVVYFVVMRFSVMKSSAFSSLYAGISAPGEYGFGAIIQTMLSNPVFVLRSLITPEKAQLFAQLMAPLVLLPLRKPAYWIVLLPASVLTLFTSGTQPMIGIAFQYTFNWAPYVFALSAVELSLMASPLRQRAAGWALLAATALANLQWGVYSPALNVHGGYGDVALQSPSDSERQYAKDLDAMMAGIPKGARLCTSNRVQAHTTDHLENWSLRDGTFDCEYLLWSSIPGDAGANHAFEDIAAKKYVLHEQRGVFSLAKKVPPAPAAPAPP